MTRDRPCRPAGARRPHTIPGGARALAAGILLATFGMVDLASAQAPAARSRLQRPVQAGPQDEWAAAAERALVRGRLDEATALAAARGDDHPAARTIRGRMDIARGAYEEAEAWLVPAADALPGGDAALELGLLYLRLGRREAAAHRLNGILDSVPAFTSPRDLGRAARAARGLREFRTANTFFREASAAAPADPSINTAWGELFLEKFNRSDAVRSFRAALASDPEWVPAHVGLARAIAEENPPAAAAAARRALELNPGFAPAHLFLAELELDEGNFDEARREIGRALAVNPSSLEARALLGALAYVEDRLDDFEAEVARALDISPLYGEAFRIAGDHAARHYRFDDAVTLVQRALEVDPENSRAYADLGMHLLRTGDEGAARVALDRAFRADPYDVVTYNLLGLLDTLDAFTTTEVGNAVVRLHPDEAPILEDYVVSLVTEGLETLSERYRFDPTGPILIEMFPRHDDFAVRNLGLPGMIGALGACFGRVVTLDSPRARPPGSFNWQATLWHELAHVITLQLSNQRVPRWLTEGISVYEEQRARPEWRRGMELTFARALDRGETLPLADLNAGFTRPETIGLAYYQASLVVAHVAEVHGEPALRDLLVAYGDGLDTEAVLARALDTDLDRLQASFTAWVEARFGALRQALRDPLPADAGGPGHRLERLRTLAAAQPGSYGAQLALGRELKAAGDLDAALAALEGADRLVPMATGAESPRALMADLAERTGDRARAMQALEALLGDDQADLPSARRLAALAEEADDERRLRVAYERIVVLDPYDAAPHSALGRLALARGDVDEAAREFRVALAAGPIDRAAAHADLAEVYLTRGEAEPAKLQAIAALEIAPTFERAQELLLKAVEGRP